MPAEPTILLRIEFQMSLLLFVALAGYLIAYRINQSAVVGIILAGILVGPSLFGLITYTDFVSSLAHLGAVVLLFTIGLEFDIREIARVRYLVIAMVGIIVPWFGGFLLAGLFALPFATSIMIGTTLAATSIAITANVLREMGRLQTPAARAIIGAAVIDDVLALLVLSMSEGVVAGTFSVSTLLAAAAKAAAFIVAGILAGRLGIARLLRRFDATRFAHQYPESILIFAMMIAFLYAVSAELAGLSAIVGSFLAGASFAGMDLKHGQVLRHGSEHLQVIFASIFFISLGVILDLRLFSLELLWFLAALTGVAMLTKAIGCGLPAWLGGMGLRDALVVGIGMVPRGEVAMVVALLGLDQRLISQETYAALILMSLLTTVLPPLVLRNWLFAGSAGPG